MKRVRYSPEELEKRASREARIYRLGAELNRGAGIKAHIEIDMHRQVVITMSMDEFERMMDEGETGH